MDIIYINYIYIDTYSVILGIYRYFMVDPDQHCYIHTRQAECLISNLSITVADISNSYEALRECKPDKAHQLLTIYT